MCMPKDDDHAVYCSFQKQTSYTFRGYVLLGERYDKISGLYPSYGLIAEPLLSEPLWALLLDAPYMGASSPTLNHFTASVSRSIDKSVRLRKFFLR